MKLVPASGQRVGTAPPRNTSVATSETAVLLTDRSTASLHGDAPSARPQLEDIGATPAAMRGDLGVTPPSPLPAKAPLGGEPAAPSKPRFAEELPSKEITEADRAVDDLLDREARDLLEHPEGTALVPYEGDRVAPTSIEGAGMFQKSALESMDSPSGPISSKEIETAIDTEAPPVGAAKAPEKPLPSEPFDITKVGAKAEPPQMLDMAQFTEVKLKPGQSALYILRDADGTILKVGKTSAAAAKNRFSVYKGAGKKTGRELRLEVHPLEESARKAEHYESALRAQLEGVGHALPWDNTRGRLGRPGFGTPGEGVRTPPVTKGEMEELLEYYKGNLREVGKDLGVHRRTADLWAKALAPLAQGLQIGVTKMSEEAIPDTVPEEFWATIEESRGSPKRFREKLNEMTREQMIHFYWDVPGAG